MMLQWPMAMCGFHPDFIYPLTKQEDSLALGEEISDLKRTGATSTKAKATAKTELSAHVVAPVAPIGSETRESFARRKEAWRWDKRRSGKVSAVVGRFPGTTRMEREVN